MSAVLSLSMLEWLEVCADNNKQTVSVIAVSDSGGSKGRPGGVWELSPCAAPLMKLVAR